MTLVLLLLSCRAVGLLACLSRKLLAAAPTTLTTITPLPAPMIVRTRPTGVTPSTRSGTRSRAEGHTSARTHPEAHTGEHRTPPLSLAAVLTAGAAASQRPHPRPQPELGECLGERARAPTHAVDALVADLRRGLRVQPGPPKLQTALAHLTLSCCGTTSL